TASTAMVSTDGNASLFDSHSSSSKSSSPAAAPAASPPSPAAASNPYKKNTKLCLAPLSNQTLSRSHGGGKGEAATVWSKKLLKLGRSWASAAAAACLSTSPPPTMAAAAAARTHARTGMERNGKQKRLDCSGAPTVRSIRWPFYRQRLHPFPGGFLLLSLLKRERSD
uniref:Uncharacterized protein n=1 Tax=Aegilops tauschii subsp. strangulata TaxID=200361 RepID=A0A453J013_AEGTS